MLILCFSVTYRVQNFLYYMENIESHLPRMAWREEHVDLDKYTFYLVFVTFVIDTKQFNLVVVFSFSFSFWFISVNENVIFFLF